MKKWSIAICIAALAATVILAGCSGGNATAAPVDVTSNQGVNSSNLPPDPGAAGKATVAGIDSDNDGVRDDVQRRIVATWGNSQKTMMAARQHAKAVQKMLVTADPGEVRAVETEALRAVACVFEMFDDAQEAIKITRPVAGWIVNTPERAAAMASFSDLLSGKVFPGAKGTAAQVCDVDPATLPN